TRTGSASRGFGSWWTSLDIMGPGTTTARRTAPTRTARRSKPAPDRRVRNYLLSTATPTSPGLRDSGIPSVQPGPIPGSRLRQFLLQFLDGPKQACSASQANKKAAPDCSGAARFRLKRGVVA